MRLAKLAYNQLDPEQKAAWDEVVAGPRKKMHGPFFIWLHSPELLSRGQKLGLYARYQSSLPQRLSELCILMMAVHWKAPGEWVDHAPIARELGVDADAIEALRRGQPAKFKAADETAAYELAQELLASRSVSDATYARVKAVLGRTRHPRSRGRARLLRPDRHEHEGLRPEARWRPRPVCGVGLPLCNIRQRA